MHVGYVKLAIFDAAEFRQQNVTNCYNYVNYFPTHALMYKTGIITLTVSSGKRNVTV